VIAGDRRLPIREIELELKSGEELELYQLAIQLVETLPLKLYFTSKAERGFMLVPESIRSRSKPRTRAFPPTQPSTTR